MGKPIEYNATLEKRDDHTDALTTFKIVPDEPFEADPMFVPGQYTTLGLNNEEKPDLGSVKRAMSIASAPEKEGPLEFYIRYVSRPESDNPLTHLLWKLADGDRVWMRTKAVGKFTVPHTIDPSDERMRILVAAGTGLAPCTSMVRSDKIRDDACDLSNYAILHGASYPDDLGYREELEALSASNRLHYRCSVSRPNEAPDWKGDSGRVEDYFKPERIEELEASLGFGPGEMRPDRAVIYICGLTGTITQTILRLLDRGFIPDDKKIRRALEVPEDLASNVFYEQYDTEPVIDIKDPEVVEPLKDRMQKALATR